MLVNCFLENRVRPWQIQAKEHHGAQWEGWKRNHKHEVGKEVGDWDGSQCSTFNSSMVPYYQVYWGTGKSSLECQIKLVYMWSLVSARSDKSSYGTVIKWSRCAFLEKVFFIYWDKEPHFKNSYCGHYSVIEFINIGIFITFFFCIIICSWLFFCYLCFHPRMGKGFSLWENHFIPWLSIPSCGQTMTQDNLASHREKHKVKTIETWCYFYIYPCIHLIWKYYLYKP